jgi:hypothetical protein
LNMKKKIMRLLARALGLRFVSLFDAPNVITREVQRPFAVPATGKLFLITDLNGLASR